MIKKRSIKIQGHTTSFSLEDEFFDALKKIAAQELCSLVELIQKIDLNRNVDNLSSAIRVYILKYYQNISNF